MCTAIAKVGSDLIYGFNLDIDPAVWNFGLYMTKNWFSVGITVGKTRYLTHGVNKNGCFGNVPYMNGKPFAPPKGARRERIDLMTDRYIRGKYSFGDIGRILESKTPVCVPAVTLHSLVGSPEGELLIIEPGIGYRRVEENYAVLTNFPLLDPPEDLAWPYYGKERYDRALSVLKGSGDDFSVRDALSLLNDVKQDGKWATRVSFVYSRNENAVYYFQNGDFSRIGVHRFA